MKVVEKILGRRMSTRPVKKPQKGKSCFSPKVDQPNPDVQKNLCGEKNEGKVKEAEHRMDRDKHQENADVEEEEEEQVEEFYLKYKGL